MRGFLIVPGARPTSIRKNRTYLQQAGPSVIAHPTRLYFTKNEKNPLKAYNSILFNIICSKWMGFHIETK